MHAFGPWMIAGWILAASGALHLLVQLGAPMPWEGPVSWRKPILFGFSSALTAWSLGWVLARVKPRRADQALAWVGATELVLEVALISIQAWRGVASHFNHSTTLDDSIQWAMTVLIFIVSLAVADLTWRCLAGFDDWPDMRDAARWGMVLLAVSCVAGWIVSLAGEWRLSRGLSPSQWGQAGVPKFPHGAAMHALQALPIIAWMLNQAGLGVAARRKAVFAMGVMSLAWLGYATAQTLAGLGRVEPGLPGLILLALGAMGAGAAAFRRG